MPDKNQGRLKPIYAQILSLLLWLLIAGLGLYSVYTLFRLSTTVYALVGKDYYTGVLVSQVVTVVAGLVWIVSVVVSGETLREHTGERKTWRLLGWMIGVELVLLILGIFFG